MSNNQQCCGNKCGCHKEEISIETLLKQRDALSILIDLGFSIDMVSPGTSLEDLLSSINNKIDKIVNI